MASNYAKAYSFRWVFYLENDYNLWERLIFIFYNKHKYEKISTPFFFCKKGKENEQAIYGIKINISNMCNFAFNFSVI